MPDPICAALAAVEASNQFGRFARHNFGAPVRAGNNTGVVGKTIIPQRLATALQRTEQITTPAISGVIDPQEKTPPDQRENIMLVSLASAASLPVLSQIWQRRKSGADFYESYDLAI